MPISYSFIQRAIALSLPFVFLFVWVSCIAVCSEMIGHAEDAPGGVAAEATVFDGSDDDCAVTPTAALLHETKSVQIALSVDSEIGKAKRQYFFKDISGALSKPRVRSRAPATPPRLYLQFHSFRI